VAAAVSSITFCVAVFEPRTALVISVTDIPFSDPHHPGKNTPGSRPFPARMRLL
jgi:hypothetical protein